MQNNEYLEKLFDLQDFLNNKNIFYCLDISNNTKHIELEYGYDYEEFIEICEFIRKLFDSLPAISSGVKCGVLSHIRIGW
jgi:hypothetical protein